MQSCIRIALIAVVACSVFSCTSTSLIEEQDAAFSSQSPQWPPEPLPARIKYLHSVSVPADIGVGDSWLNKVWRYFKGGVPDRMSKPQGVHVDSDGRMYVVDPHARAIHVFASKTSRYYRFPDKPIDKFIYPVGVTADDHGRVYISDSSSHVVHVFSDYGKKYERAIGEQQLVRPTGLALRETSNELLVVDTIASEIVVFNRSDYSLRHRVGSNGREADALHYPTSIFVSNDNSVYVTDSLNFRIQILNADLEFVNRFGEAGDGPGYFSRPKGVALDSDGHVYVVDALFDNIQIFDVDGNLLLTFGTSGHNPGQFWLPNEIYIDQDDRIYICDTYNSRVQVFQYLTQSGSP